MSLPSGENSGCKSPKVPSGGSVRNSFCSVFDRHPHDSCRTLGCPGFGEDQLVSDGRPTDDRDDVASYHHDGSLNIDQLPFPPPHRRNQVDGGSSIRKDASESDPSSVTGPRRKVLAGRVLRQAQGSRVRGQRLDEEVHVTAAGAAPPGIGYPFPVGRKTRGGRASTLGSKRDDPQGCGRHAFRSPWRPPQGYTDECQGYCQ